MWLLGGMSPFLLDDQVFKDAFLSSIVSLSQFIFLLNKSSSLVKGLSLESNSSIIFPLS